LKVPCAFSSLPPVNMLNLNFDFIENNYFMNFVSRIVLKFSFLNFEKNKCGNFRPVIFLIQDKYII
jgi:hypothetical protein